MINRFFLRPFILRTMSTALNSERAILVDKVGKVTTIGINRPDKRNCLDLKTACELQSVIKEFEQDNGTVAGVLYGTGGNFCSGYDLEELANLHNDRDETNVLNTPLVSLTYVKKPLVAALSGYSVAGGLELALMCDLRVIEETAVLGLYGRRFGVPLVDGATVRLQAMIGLSRALDLVLTGRSLNAKEAFEWGLANRIVACGTGLGQAIQLATCLVKFPQDCLHTDRNSVYNAAYNKIFDELLEYEKTNSKKVNIQSIIEGAKKFLSGIGKHGKAYNLTEKESCDWEKEYNETPKSKL